EARLPTGRLREISGVLDDVETEPAPARTLGMQRERPLRVRGRAVLALAGHAPSQIEQLDVGEVDVAVHVVAQRLLPNQLVVRRAGDRRSPAAPMGCVER